MEDDHFNQLYEEHARGLLGYLIKLTGSPETAQDLLQELFITVYQRYDNLNIDNEKSYFFTMAYRLYAKWVGTQKRQRESTLELSKKPEQRTSFEKELEWELLRENILNELRAVDPILENIFVLRIDHSFKLAEIAHIVGKSKRSINRYIANIGTIIEQKFGRQLDDYTSADD